MFTGGFEFIAWSALTAVSHCDRPFTSNRLQVLHVSLLVVQKFAEAGVRYQDMFGIGGCAIAC